MGVAANTDAGTKRGKQARRRQNTVPEMTTAFPRRDTGPRVAALKKYGSIVY
jgi:hypothetical protein